MQPATPTPTHTHSSARPLYHAKATQMPVRIIMKRKNAATDDADKNCCANVSHAFATSSTRLLPSSLLPLLLHSFGVAFALKRGKAEAEEEAAKG